MKNVVRSLLAAMIAIAFASGCGQKGPLYHPQEKPAAKKPVKSTPEPETQRPAQ